MSKPKGKSIFGPGGLRVVFDPKDPDTPCMVYRGDTSATFHCALDTGELVGSRDSYDLTRAQSDFLAKLEPEADAFYDAYTHNNPENT